MKSKTLLGIIALIFFSSVFAGCAVKNKANSSIMMEHKLLHNLLEQIIVSFNITRSPQQHFYDLTNGLQIRVEPTQPQTTVSNNICQLASLDIFQIPTITYVRAMGFKEMNPGQDYTLIIRQNRIDLNVQNGEINIALGVQLKDKNGSLVFNQESFATDKISQAGDIALNRAYTTALEQINWNQIASFLRTAQFAKDEPNKAVDGLGNTALEHTIIRWDVQSRPQGADIFWRVVSKTPNVKSTNNKYLTTTPYEATKALDIRGLTYQNSGNVRIILRCEKDGYMPQEKEYDVRMILDQEEISSFFRLVKEEK